MPKRLILQAQDFQPEDDSVIAFAESREAAIAREVLDALQTMGDALDAHDLQAKIDAHDVTGIAAIIASPRIVDALQKAYSEISDTYIEAAETEAEEKFGGLIVYDPLVAAGELSGARETFMGSILGQASEVVADQLMAALRDGADPESIAELLKQVIGLTPQQAQAVSNFRNLLENGNRQALARSLRDRRFDATVQAWVDGIAQPDAAKVDAMVQRYAERMLAYRAQTIARTESLQAATGGVRDAYVQAVNAGRLLASEVKRRWLVTPDERLCVICGSIPLLNDIHGVGVNEPYQSILGPIMAPLAHVRCRCTEVYTADLSRVAANPFALAA